MQSEWRRESIKENLRSFPVLGDFLGWLLPQIPQGWRAFYFEYPALLGQVFWLGLFILVNGVLAWRGIDTTAYAPGVLFFSFDILNFNLIEEPYLLIFVAMVFFIAWIINKLLLIWLPRIRNSSNAKLFLFAFISFVMALVIFGVSFTFMVGILLA